MEQVQALLPTRGLKHHFAFERLVQHKSGYRRVPFVHTELAHKPEAKYVSLSIFTANLTTTPDQIAHIYLMGALQNAVLKEVVYRDWDMIIYVDDASWQTYPQLYERYFLPILHKYPHIWVVAVDWRTQLPHEAETTLKTQLSASTLSALHNEHGWDLARLVAAFQRDAGNIPLQYAKTVYRFFPGGYNLAFVSRDADARINLREEVAMNEWLHSTYTFSRLFDNPAHSNPMLAGMWGAKSQCHNLLHDPRLYGTCQRGDVPLPDIIPQIANFLSDTETLMRGYGIDELFLGTVDDRIAHDYYENVLTYGKGGYYAGSVVFSLFTDRQSLKVGHRMVTLLPCQGPDDCRGSHQTEKNYTLNRQGVPILGRDCYFVGEDLPLKAHVSSAVVDWLIHWTLHHHKATAHDLSAEALKTQFRQFGIDANPRQFASALKTMSLGEFQDTMGFDKRILPHFWYALLAGTNENVAFFEAMGSFNPNEYEIRVFEAATRHAFLEHTELRPVLLQVVGTDTYTEVSEKVAKVLTTGRGRLLVHDVNLTPFFRTVRKYTKQHSRALPWLQPDELESYWSELLNVYPFSALRQLSLEF